MMRPAGLNRLLDKVITEIIEGSISFAPGTVDPENPDTSPGSGP
jgi:hypothetical protein